VEQILANSTPSLCVADSTQLAADGNNTSSLDSTNCVGADHSSSVDSASGTSIESDEIIITEYLDVEFVEETETVTVIESVCENVSPASTFGGDDEGSHSANIPDLEYDGPLLSERELSSTLQQEVDDNVVTSANVVIARHMTSQDKSVKQTGKSAVELVSNPVVTLHDEGTEPFQESDKSAMFYPQWLHKGGGSVATSLPKSLMAESRKRLHSSNFVDSDDDDSDTEPRSYQSCLMAAHGLNVGRENAREQDSFVLHNYNDDGTGSWSRAPLNESLNANVDSFILNFDETDTTVALWNLDKYSSLEPAPRQTEFTSACDLPTTDVSRLFHAVAAESSDDRSDNRFDDSLEEDIVDSHAVPVRIDHSDENQKSNESPITRKLVGDGITSYFSNDSLDSTDASGWSEVRRGHRKAPLLNKPSISSLENISDDSLAESRHEQQKTDQKSLKVSQTNDSVATNSEPSLSCVIGSKKASKCHVSAKNSRMFVKSKSRKGKQIVKTE
jgi:hypothetical protein